MGRGSKCVFLKWGKKGRGFDSGHTFISFLIYLPSGAVNSPLFPPVHMLEGGGGFVQAVRCAERRAWVGVQVGWM